MRTMILTASTILSAVIFGLAGNEQAGLNRKAGPSLNGATGWLNSKPLSLANLHGKVVLIDF